EEASANARAGDLHPLLTEIDLELVPRLRLEPNCCELARNAQLPMRCEHALKRTYVHLHAALPQEPLHDDGVSGSRTIEQLDCERTLAHIKHAGLRTRLHLRGLAQASIPLHAAH